MDRNNLQTAIIIVILLLILSMFFFIDEFNLSIVKNKMDYYDTKEFTVNLSNNPDRYLKISMSFEVNEKLVLKELHKKRPIIEDIILIYLSTLTTDELDAQQTKQEIKDILLSKINNHLSTGDIENIYFTNFVWQ